jgi:hypothetical protein
MGYEVKEVRPTPNPNAVKFVLDRPIAAQPTSFFNAESAQGHPVASQLFGVDGVTSVLLLGDFVTVNKRAEVQWLDVRRRVEEILNRL